MKYYKKDIDSDKLICLLCSHYCKLKIDQIGICGINKNTGSKIDCLVYGHIAAMNVDPIEKKPLYHFYPQSKSLSLGTVGCNFKCSFCQNWGISQEKKINKEKFFSPIDIVSLALKHNCKSISYTYNEPTIFYPYAKDIAIEAKKYNIKSVYVSNGFESSEVASDMIGIIDAINVDLKCFTNEYYKKLGGSLDVLLKNLKFFSKSSIHLEITTLLVPSKNDSDEEVTKIAKFIKDELGEDIPWHISAFHPDYKELELPRTSKESLLKAKKIGNDLGLKHVYIGNAGIDNHTRCVKCEKVLIHRQYFNTLSNNLHNNKCSCSNVLKGVFMKKREMSVAGSFYPKEKSEILRYIEHFNKGFEYKKLLNNIKALIVPHAGYVYSGFTANIAYNLASKQNYKTILVIGPSHKVYFEGASISIYDSYETPLGDISIDMSYIKELKNEFSYLGFNENSHHEHSTETQAPFIKHYFPNSNIIEIVYGKLDSNDLSSLLLKLLNNDDVLLVISTDLSHFHTLVESNIIDKNCIKSIKYQNLEDLDKTEACGMIGLKALLLAQKNKNLKNIELYSCTSAEVTKDESRVVAYTSFIVGN